MKNVLVCCVVAIMVLMSCGEKVTYPESLAIKVNDTMVLRLMEKGKIKQELKNDSTKIAILHNRWIEKQKQKAIQKTKKINDKNEFVLLNYKTDFSGNVMVGGGPISYKTIQMAIREAVVNNYISILPPKLYEAMLTIGIKYEYKPYWKKPYSTQWDDNPFPESDTGWIFMGWPWLSDCKFYHNQSTGQDSSRCLNSFN